jgi:UPF0755 protein
MSDGEYSIDEPKRSWVWLVSLLLSLLLVVGLSIGAYLLTKINQAVSSESIPANFLVAKGDGTRAIAANLLNQKIISSYWTFLLYSKLSGAGSKIRAGAYLLDRNMSITQIVDVLTQGRIIPSDRKVTITEGLTNRQIGREMEKRNIFSANDFEKKLAEGGFEFKYNDAARNFNYQGFLFPDTYALAPGSTGSQFIQKMLSNFENKFSPKMESDTQSGRRKLSDIIIMASIIEKEVGRNKETISESDLSRMKEERKLVASVFYNRLSLGMPLDSDATVNYITGKSDRQVSLADTKIKSPYNTYKVLGLPPVPISNPGLDSITAAIYPAQSDYLFFLNKPDGEAVFSKTLSEHNANKARFLK